MKFCIITFGCKVNQCESDNIALTMIKAGYINSKESENPEIFIINSCTVTGESDRKLRQTFHRIKRNNPGSIVILTGCLPQALSKDSNQLVPAEIIIGNSQKYLIPEYLDKYFDGGNSKIYDVSPTKFCKKFDNVETNIPTRHARAFLKIEDGCNRFCSYCIIPYARGSVRSKPLTSIKNDAEKLSKAGYREIVVVGINLFSYGMDINCSVADAIEVIANVPGIERIRLGSLEPDLISDNLILRLSKIDKLCPQFHLSLQSGSNKILKSMRRRYTRDEYIDVVKKLRNKFPSATFTTDLMVGFAGETEEDFEDSLKLIEEVKFLKVHVFPYSRRPGTLADKFPNQVDKKTKSLRVKKAIEISENTSKVVLNNFIGKRFNVLYESRGKDGRYEGYTENYIYVKSEFDQDIRGKILNTEIVSLENGFCSGVIKNLKKIYY